MRYFIFLNFFLCLLTACSPAKEITATGNATNTPFWTSDRDSTKKNEFRMLFSTPKARITGICIVKQINGKWKGSIINEFGLKVLDFETSANKCILLNVIPFLDKWTIKKVLSSDIQYIMEIDNPDYAVGLQSKKYWVQDTLTATCKKEKELQRYPNGEIRYTNHKHSLTYSFTKIYETER